MSKQWWEKRSFKNHMDPDKEEQLKWIKIEIENNVKRCLKIIKSLHPSRDGHLKRKTELIQLVEEMQKEYQSLYDLYDNLRGEVKKKLVHHHDHDHDHDEDDEIRSSCSSFKSSADETYYSPEELISSDGKYDHHHHHQHNSDEEEEIRNKNMENYEQTSPDSENKIISSTSELDETLTMTSTSSFDGYGGGGEVVPESMEVIRELRVQVEESENKRQKLQDECVDLREKLIRAEEEILQITKNHHSLEEQRLTDVKELESKIQSLNLEIETMLQNNNNRRAAAIEEARIEVMKDGVGGEASGLIQVPEKIGLKAVLGKNPKVLVRSLSKKNLDFKDEQIMISGSTTPEPDKESLKRKIFELERNIKNKDNELLNLEKMLNDQKDKMCNQVTSLKLEIKSLGKDLETFEEENLKLKTQNESYSDKITQLDHKIAEKIQEKNDLEEIINNLKNDQQQAGTLLAQSKSGYQIAEKKVEEMAEAFCKNLTDNLRILSRRIRVAEQMHLENRELYEKTKKGFAKQSKDIKQVKQIREVAMAANELLLTQEAVALKFEERIANFLNRISKVSCELKFAKDWVNRKNRSIGYVKEELNCLVDQLDDKEGEILVSRKKVWKYENKIRELEKLIVEREEGMLSLKEEKREAIRQLCVWIDYHRSRSDYYKKMISEITAGVGNTP